MPNFVIEFSVPYYPLTAGTSYGLLYNMFGINTLVSAFILFTSVMLQQELLAVCFYKKHQAIAVILRRHVFPTAISWAGALSCPISVAIAIVSNFIVQRTKEEQWEYILAEFPDYVEGFKSVSNFEIAIPNPAFFAMLVFATVVLSVPVGLLVFLVPDTFSMMGSLKKQMSPVTFQKHKYATRSLYVQCAVSVFCTIPIGTIFFLYMIEYRYCQLVSEVFIVLLSAHSSINTVSLMIFFPPYRKFIVEQFRVRKLSTRVPEAKVFSVVSNNNLM